MNMQYVLDTFYVYTNYIFMDMLYVESYYSGVELSQDILTSFGMRTYILHSELILQWWMSTFFTLPTRAMAFRLTWDPSTGEHEIVKSENRTQPK